ncbi:hypothetical protein [Paenibacillus sp. SN-8-1]|uniref:hypothetical protein n=1 Tax=Paenibacillus sp. SN-8-1 TaxID=3435409 RepID=UPI003D9A161E
MSISIKTPLKYSEIKDVIRQEQAKSHLNTKEYNAYKANMLKHFAPVFNEKNNNRFNYLIGLLTQTSPYKNSEGNADWARDEFLKAYQKYAEI